MVEGDTDAGHLSLGVHPGVGAPGSHEDGHRLAAERLQRLFNDLLDRGAVLLSLPSDVVRPVVGEGQFESAHDEG